MIGETVVVCPKCETTVAYRLVGTVYPGGKDREHVFCPKCKKELHSEMTSQSFSVRVIKENEQWKLK